VNPIVIISALCLLLTGCSSTVVRNPAKELCSGTKRPYEINGTTYHPQDHFDYEEEGVASWYGPGFHERPKSCGGRYDMHGLSAAHKTLPIPSVVEVTNIENGKRIKLVVDDRGPFVDNRIIDLSKGAAQKLGVHQKGLAKVKVRAIPEESLALVNHLKQYGRYGQTPNGKSWDAIYREEIANDFAHRPLEPAKHAPKFESTVARSNSKQPAKLQPTVARIDKHNPLPKAQAATYVQEPDLEIDSLLQEISTAPKKKTRSPTHSSQAHYVHVGSFIQKRNAEKLCQELARHGRTNVAETKSSGQRFFAVQLGPFNDKQQAQKLLATLENDGHYAVVCNN
jgi:rare lipoprotein A